MEANPESTKQVKDTEDYVLLDLNDVCVEADIPANAPYVLSGLDTLNPMLVIGGRLKLVGEYQETVGTCFVFSENDDVPMVVYPETGPSEMNLIMDKCIIDPNQGPSKRVTPVASLHRVLKFRLPTEDDFPTADRISDENSQLACS